MKKKIKSLVRKACNRIFLMLAQGIIEKNPGGSIHIHSDVIVNGNIAGKESVYHNITTSDKNISFHKKDQGTIWGEKLGGYVKLTSGGQQGRISLRSHNVDKLQ